MVLFYEHEKKPEPTRLRIWAGRIIWTVFIIVGMSWGGLLLMSRHSGPDSAVCLGIQDYLSRVSGAPARVGVCNYGSVYPYFAADMSQITVDNPVKGSVTVRSALIVADFWDLFFSRQRIYDLKIESLKWNRAGSPLTISNLEIKNDPPRLEADISSGREKAKIKLALNARPGRQGKPVYSIGDRSDISIAMRDISLQGVVDFSKYNITEIDFTDISVKGFRLKSHVKFIRTAQDASNVIISAGEGNNSLSLSFVLSGDKSESRLTMSAADAGNVAAVRDLWARMGVFLPDSVSECYARLFSASGNDIRARELLSDGTCRDVP